MIEDPLYLDKNIPIYAVTAYANIVRFSRMQETLKSLQKFGYKNIIKYDTSYIAPDDFDFNIDISDKMKSTRSRKSATIAEVYAIAAILKKMRNQSKRYLIINETGIMHNDIPLSVLKYNLMAFLEPLSYDDLAYGSHENFHTKGLFLDQYSSHILYKTIVDAVEFDERSVYHFLIKKIKTNNLLEINSGLRPTPEEVYPLIMALNRE